jgi:hypothetical protein
VTSWTYITQSVPWALGGLLIGFLMARSTVAFEAIADAVHDEGEPMTVDLPARRPRFNGITVLGAVIVVLGVFTAVQSYVQSAATDRLTECQTAYANGFADALDARSDATSAAQDALDDLLTTVASITPTPEGREEFRVALSSYLSKRVDAKKTQKENPYPPAPRDVCREAG